MIAARFERASPASMPQPTPVLESSRPFQWGAWIVITALLIGLAGAFTLLSRKHTEVTQEADAARLLRMGRQAVMEVDVAILDMIARREQVDMSRYYRAVNKLSRHGAESFPPTIHRNGRDVPSWPAIASLKDAWSRIAAAAQAGDSETARKVYVDHDVSQTMSQFVESSVAFIEAKDEVLARLQNDIRLAIASCIVLMFAIGLFIYLISSRGEARDKAKLRDAIHSANAARETANDAKEAANASREKVTRLFQMTDMLQSASDHHDANAVLRATAIDLIPGFGGALYVFNSSRDRLALSTSWNREGRPELPDTIGLQQCWSLKRGKPHVNVPGTHKLSCEHFSGEDCVLEIPMMARGEILGLLQLSAPGEDGEERLAGVLDLGSALADAMSLALANIALRDKLRGQALRDPLTGLYNRRYMEDTLQRVVRLAEREHKEVAVIMIDLDHFKRLNDSYGHAKGDAVLRDTASVLLNQLRETDVACRYGGEELIVVMPNCGLEAALVKAERLRVSIEALSEPNGAQVSASMGVAAIPETSIAAKDLLAAADAALYEAKQAGRNRVAAAAQKMGAMSTQATVTLLAAE